MDLEPDVSLHPDARPDYDAGVTRYQSAKAALEYADDRIDLVYIASNHASHADYAIAALERGKRVALANKESLVAGGPLASDVITCRTTQPRGRGDPGLRRRDARAGGAHRRPSAHERRAGALARAVFLTLPQTRARRWEWTACGRISVRAPVGATAISSEAAHMSDTDSVRPALRPLWSA